MGWVEGTTQLTIWDLCEAQQEDAKSVTQVLRSVCCVFTQESSVMMLCVCLTSV